MFKLLPGLSHPNVPLNPNGIGYCPNCGAHAPMSQIKCLAIDCVGCGYPIAPKKDQK